MSGATNHRELSQEMRERLDDLRRIAARVKEALNDPRADHPDPLFVAGVSSYIHDFFNVVEDVAYRVSQEVNGETPGGPDSHKRLIERMTFSVPRRRRRLFSAELIDDLNKLLQFRHFFRHKYGVELDWTKVRDHGERVAQLAPRLEADIAAFAEWLLLPNQFE